MEYAADKKHAMRKINSFKWQKYDVTYSIPTISLVLLIVVSITCNTLLAFYEVYPLVLAAILQYILAYLAFTPLHEAVHDNVASKKAILGSSINQAAGWISGFILLAPFPAFRILHLRHHGHTNHPTKDPDAWVDSTSWYGLAAKCFTIIPYYYSILVFKMPSNSRKLMLIKIRTLLELLILTAAVSAAVLLSSFTFVISMWIIPAISAIATLALLFDWLPHHPHKSRQRIYDTRIIVGSKLNWLLLGQNYHLMHHLYPHIPFYSYKNAFEDLQPELKTVNAEIIT